MIEKHLGERACGQSADGRERAIRRRAWSAPRVITATTSAAETKPTTYFDTGASGS